MQIGVEHKDSSGVVHNRQESISRLQFLKSFAIAGQGSMPGPLAVKRTIGAFLFYSEYLEWQSMLGGHFSSPPPGRRDPTERNQFSNQAGKAIADLLARRIDSAIVTYNYEAEMKRQFGWIRGKRPDFVCDTGSSQFTLEAKGFTSASLSAARMSKIKNQSQQGPITVSFSVACASFNLYNRIRVKYHDPVGDEPYNRDVAHLMARAYYGTLVQFLEDRRFVAELVTLGDRRVFRVTLSEDQLLWHSIAKCAAAKLGLGRVSLLLAPEIKDVAQTGEIRQLPPAADLPSAWMDSDGIGIEVEGLQDESRGDDPQMTRTVRPTAPRRAFDWADARRHHDL